MINWKNVFKFFGLVITGVIVMSLSMTGIAYVLEFMPVAKNAFDVFVKSVVVITSGLTFVFGFFLLFIAFEDS